MFRPGNDTECRVFLEKALWTQITKKVEKYEYRTQLEHIRDAIAMQKVSDYLNMPDRAT